MRRLVLVLALFASACFVAPAFGASYSLSVQTDRPSYVGMAQINITGTVSPAPGPDTAVVVVVSNPSGAVVDIEEDPVDQAGNFNQTTLAGGSITCGGSPCWFAGTYVVNATWGGYGSSATEFTTFTYAPLSEVSTSVSCAPLSFMTEASSTCSVAVSGGVGTTDGETVEFSQSGGTGSVSFPSPATCTLSGNDCSIPVKGGSPGMVTIQASYPGDADNAASSGNASVTVTQARPTTSVSCGPSGVKGFEVGLSSPCTATVSGATGTISGELVTFSQAGGNGSVFFPSPPTCKLPTAGGEETCQILLMGGSSGSVIIQAAYSGDTNNAPSSGTTTNAVGLVTTTTTDAPPPSTTTSTSSILSTTVGTKASTTTGTSPASSSMGGVSSATYFLAAVAAVLVVFGAAISRRKKAGGQGNRPAEGPSTLPTTP